MRGLRIGSAGKLGRGVFATTEFRKDDLVELAPLLVVSDQREALIVEQLTVLGSYCYDHGNGQICLALGYASLYNHSSRPNAVYTLHEDRIEVRALRRIKAGTQVRVNYNGDPKDRTPIDWDSWERS
jgi:uncharacterized protein